jgi:hypothetical protein
MKSFAAVVNPGSLLNSLQMRDFEPKILSESPSELGGSWAKALKNKAKKLHQIYVVLRYKFDVRVYPSNRLFGEMWEKGQPSIVKITLMSVQPSSFAGLFKSSASQLPF